MDVLILSRLQFAMTAGFHFIFVSLTLGLSVLVAWMETCYVRTGDEIYLKMTKFWGKLFLINFAVGVVTGLTMEFQFGMNWAEYSKYVGDIFGVPLAIEAMVAFFLESTFIGLWIFGWNRVSKKVHALAIWIVALASNLSALWILLANGWMQHPVGFVLRNNRAELVDFMAVITSPYGWLKFAHTVLGGYVVGAFFVMGIAAWHLLRKNQPLFYKKSFRMAAVFGLISSFLVIGIGDFHAAEVAKTQPTKLAAMESLWETERGVPLYLIVLPDAKNERLPRQRPAAGHGGLSEFQADGHAGDPLSDPVSHRLLFILEGPAGDQPAFSPDYALYDSPALSGRAVGLDCGGGGAAALDRLRRIENLRSRLQTDRACPGADVSDRLRPLLQLSGNPGFLPAGKICPEGAGGGPPAVCQAPCPEGGVAWNFKSSGLSSGVSSGPLIS